MVLKTWLLIVTVKSVYFAMNKVMIQDYLLETFALIWVGGNLEFLTRFMINAKVSIKRSYWSN